MRPTVPTSWATSCRCTLGDVGTVSRDEILWVSVCTLVLLVQCYISMLSTQPQQFGSCSSHHQCTTVTMSQLSHWRDIYFAGDRHIKISHWNVSYFIFSPCSIRGFQWGQNLNGWSREVSHPYVDFLAAHKHAGDITNGNPLGLHHFIVNANVSPLVHVNVANGDFRVNICIVQKHWRWSKAQCGHGCTVIKLMKVTHSYTNSSMNQWGLSRYFECRSYYCSTREPWHGWPTYQDQSLIVSNFVTFYLFTWIYPWVEIYLKLRVFKVSHPYPQRIRSKGLVLKTLPTHESDGFQFFAPLPSYLPRFWVREYA